MKNSKFQKQDIDYNKFDKKALYELVCKYRNTVYRQEKIMRKVLQNIYVESVRDAYMIDLINQELNRDVVE